MHGSRRGCSTKTLGTWGGLVPHVSPLQSGNDEKRKRKRKNLLSLYLEEEREGERRQERTIREGKGRGGRREGEREGTEEQKDRKESDTVLPHSTDRGLRSKCSGLNGGWGRVHQNWLFSVRNQKYGVRACENSQMHVSHGQCWENDKWMTRMTGGVQVSYLLIRKVIALF